MAVRSKEKTFNDSSLFFSQLNILNKNKMASEK